MDAQTKECYLNTMEEDGVFVFKDLLATQDLQIIRNEISVIREIIMAKIKNLPRPLKTYSDIAERHLDRFDFRCGFTAEIFAEIAKPIIQIIKTISPTIDFRYYWGAIPSLGGSGPTDMHRDVYPILNTTEGYNLGVLDCGLPPYYFTVLIPLVEITKANGPTEFIKGSYRRLIVDETEEPIFAPLVSPGDVIIFDGRTLHRGSANHTKDERLIAYMTFVANWYHDQTFTINDYLFPELSTKIW